jgi:lipopolysaccharide assembly protein A
MRWVYLIIVIAFVAAIVLFAIQNVQLTTMSFLGLSVRAPLAVLVVVVYVLGALTGGSLFALLRATIRATKAHWPAADRR